MSIIHVGFDGHGHAQQQSASLSQVKFIHKAHWKTTQSAVQKKAGLWHVTPET